MRRPKKWIPVLVASILIIIICAVTGVQYIKEKYGETDERVDLFAHYQIFEEDQAAVLVNNLLTEEKALIRDGEAYLSLDYVTGKYNERFYLDESSDELMYMLPERVIEVGSETRFADLDGYSGDAAANAFVWIRKDASCYVSVNFVMEYTDVLITVYDNPARVYIDPSSLEYRAAEVSKDTEIRKLGGIKSPIVAEVAAGSEVVVLDSMETWSEVRTADGFVGYIQNKYLKHEHSAERKSSFVSPVYASLTSDTEICLVWHQVFSSKDNGKIESLLSKEQGVNVISPTWFSVCDNDGNITSLADHAYVEAVHGMGMEVWGLVDNFSSEISSLEILSHKESRRNLIDRLIQAAKDYELDGINIDFESMKSDVGPHYIQFVREMSVMCRREGLILSVDNYVPTAGSRFYRCEEQGAVVDYVIVMCYDEHWKNSDAGTNASLAFVQRGIEGMLSKVPQNKVVAALPFFTRDWMFDADEEVEENDDPLSSKYVTGSTAVSMDKAAKLLKDGKAELVWDEDLAQYYGEYIEKNTIHRIWLEDARSMQMKLDVTASYDIGGVAFWKLGLETDDVWDGIGAYMNR